MGSDTTGFSQVMREFADAFTTGQRQSGEPFTKLGDESPAWLTGDKGTAVMLKIHSVLDGRLPDDWVYESVSAIADAFVDHDVADEDAAREATHEIADGLVDVYNGDRAKWLASHLLNAALIDEACSDDGIGCPADADTFTRIGLGQFHALERLANAVIDTVSYETESRE